MKLTRLREWRQIRGLNQTELGERAGVWPQTISGLEQQKQEARPSTVRRLATALDIEIEDLVGPDEDPLLSEETAEFRLERSSESAEDSPLFFELGRLLKEAERGGGPEGQMEVLELLIEQSPAGWRKELYKLYHSEQELRRSLRSERRGLPRHTAGVVSAYMRVVRSLLAGEGGEAPSRATLDDIRQILEDGRRRAGAGESPS